eukprot:m.50135 g.50135  ORF g.50135 m.50135 type:complete len:973 (+) comp7495_c0_seq1:114-3032(+)
MRNKLLYSTFLAVIFIHTVLLSDNCCHASTKLSFDKWQEQVQNETVTITEVPEIVLSDYSSSSCGAKVIVSSKHIRKASAVLSSNPDEYLNTPCKTDTWFVVELCETILIQRFSFANLEIFSSIAKTIELSVSERYPTVDWDVVGTFEIQNVRKNQVFNWPTKHFGKFVRVKILAYQGNEYYCPITHLGVYGVSLLEEFEHLSNLQSNLPELNGEHEDETHREKKHTDRIECDTASSVCDEKISTSFASSIQLGLRNIGKVFMGDVGEHSQPTTRMPLVLEVEHDDGEDDGEDDDASHSNAQDAMSLQQVDSDAKFVSGDVNKVLDVEIISEEYLSEGCSTSLEPAVMNNGSTTIHDVNKEFSVNADDSIANENLLQMKANVQIDEEFEGEEVGFKSNVNNYNYNNSNSDHDDDNVEESNGMQFFQPTISSSQTLLASRPSTSTSIVLLASSSLTPTSQLPTPLPSTGSSMVEPSSMLLSSQQRVSSLSQHSSLQSIPALPSRSSLLLSPPPINTATLLESSSHLFSAATFRLSLESSSLHPHPSAHPVSSSLLSGSELDVSAAVPNVVVPVGVAPHSNLNGVCNKVLDEDWNVKYAQCSIRLSIDMTDSSQKATQPQDPTFPSSDHCVPLVTQLSETVVTSISSSLSSSIPSQTPSFSASSASSLPTTLLQSLSVATHASSQLTSVSSAPHQIEPNLSASIDAYGISMGMDIDQEVSSKGSSEQLPTIAAPSLATNESMSSSTSHVPGHASLENVQLIGSGRMYRFMSQLHSTIQELERKSSQTSTYLNKLSESSLRFESEASDDLQRLKVELKLLHEQIQRQGEGIFNDDEQSESQNNGYWKPTSLQEALVLIQDRIVGLEIATSLLHLSFIVIISACITFAVTVLSLSAFLIARMFQLAPYPKSKRKAVDDINTETMAAKNKYNTTRSNKTRNSKKRLMQKNSSSSVNSTINKGRRGSSQKMQNRLQYT